MPSSNWLELNLSKEEDKFVRRYGELYRAQYVETIDTIFGVAKSIRILGARHKASGVQGAFGDALVQYGYIARDGGPMNKAIRSFHETLLDHEAEVRTWWASVPERKKRYWLSVKAIYANWKASLKPKTSDAPKRTTPQQPTAKAAEGEIDLATLSMSARERVEAAIRQHKRKIDLEFNERARAEGRRLLDEFFLPGMRDRLETAEREIKSLNIAIDRRQPLVSRNIFRILMAAVQPASRGNLTDEMLHDAAVAFNAKRKEIEIALCGKESERPKGPPPPTLAELMANKAAYDAKNSARAQRAAATRKANQQSDRD